MEKRIRHLSIDLWLTLIRSNKTFKPARNALFIKVFGLHHLSEEQVLMTFQEHDRMFNYINEATGRNISREEMLYIILASLGKDIHRIALREVTHFFAAADELVYTHLPEVMEEGAIDAIKVIRATGVTISLLSNTGFIPGPVLRQVLPRLGFEGVFDFQIYSDEVGASKPSAQIFEAMFQGAIKLQPVNEKQVLHIGDNVAADYNGARAAGYHAILFNLEKEKLSRVLLAALCISNIHSTV